MAPGPLLAGQNWRFHQPLSSSPSAGVMQKRWRPCSLRCWCCARGWGWASWPRRRWMAPRSPRMPPRRPTGPGRGCGSWPRRQVPRAAAAHAAADEAEDELFGEGRRGDQVPPEAASPAARDERIAAALAELEAEREAAEAEREARAQSFWERRATGQPGQPLAWPPAARSSPRSAAPTPAGNQAQRTRRPRAAGTPPPARAGHAPAAAPSRSWPGPHRPSQTGPAASAHPDGQVRTVPGYHGSARNDRLSAQRSPCYPVILVDTVLAEGSVADLTDRPSAQLRGIAPNRATPGGSR